MRRRIVFSVAALIAVLATPGCQESTTTPPEFKDDAEAVRWFRLAAEQGHADAPKTTSGSCTTGGRGRSQGFRACAHVVEHRWRKRATKVPGRIGTLLNVT